MRGTPLSVFLLIQSNNLIPPPPRGGRTTTPHAAGTEVGGERAMADQLIGGRGSGAPPLSSSHRASG